MKGSCWQPPTRAWAAGISNCSIDIKLKNTITQNKIHLHKPGRHTYTHSFRGEQIYQNLMGNANFLQKLSVVPMRAQTPTQRQPASSWYCLTECDSLGHSTSKWSTVSETRQSSQYWTGLLPTKNLCYPSVADSQVAEGHFVCLRHWEWACDLNGSVNPFTWEFYGQRHF